MPKPASVGLRLKLLSKAADTQRSQVQRTLSGDLTEEDETQAQAALAEIDGRIAAARAELVAIPAKLDAAIAQALQSTIRDQLTPQAQQLFDTDDFLERISTGLNTTIEGLQDRNTGLNNFFASIADQLDPYTMSIEEAIDFIIAKFAELNTGTTLDPQAILGFLDSVNFPELRGNFDSIIEQIPAIQEAYDQQIIRCRKTSRATTKPDSRATKQRAAGSRRSRIHRRCFRQHGRPLPREPDPTNF